MKLYGQSNCLRYLFSPLRAGGVSGHLQRQWVLQLQPVPVSHPEQHGWAHVVLPHPAEEWPAAPHWEVGWLCQPLLAERSTVVGHQPGLRGFRGPGGACQWEVQWRCLAWCQSDAQPSPGVFTSTAYDSHNWSSCSSDAHKSLYTLTERVFLE